MNTVIDIDNFDRTPCVATIGSFDGVHLGHKAMLAQLRDAADARCLPLMVVTFARHPRLLFDGECEPFLLTSSREKLALLESLGVDYAVMLDFDTCMAAMSAERFMNEVLAGALGVKVLGVGYDHHFGKPCEGEGLEQYAMYGKNAGIEVLSLSPFVVDGEKVSSTVVRRALSAGDVQAAERLLGRGYSLSGTVVRGAGIGHGIGFPTANIMLEDEFKMLPLDGVYEVGACIGCEWYKGVMNIGVKPTVSREMLRTIEVHLIDYGGDAYGKGINVTLVRRLRGELAFNDVQALKLQIGVDVARVKRGI